MCPKDFLLYLDNRTGSVFGMHPMEPVHIRCPYCGERLEIIIDSSVRRQEYIEDCQVCCKPISLRIGVSDEGQPNIEVRSEDE